LSKILNGSAAKRLLVPRCTRGLRAIPLNAFLLLQLFKRLDGSQAMQCHGLPPDTELEEVTVDTKTGQIVLIVSSSIWEARSVRSRIPWLKVTFT
jgi:hypothetical protein